MDEDKINIDYENNEYLYKIIYLIRINIPSSEYIYIIMFLLKYIGLILLSISLNQWNNKIYINDEEENYNNNNNSFSNNFYNNINSFFSKLLINGNNLNILNQHYQIFCMTGFSILLIYIVIIIYGFIYMKKKYYNKTLISFIEKKIKLINNNSHFEKKLFKFIAYFFFLIAFFHQYIIEYYIFGFLGYIFNSFKVFDSNIFYENYIINIEEHIKNLHIPTYINIALNFITIILVLAFFILFMILNSTKTAFIKNGFPLYGNRRYLTIKIIIFNLNPIYGIINIFNNSIKIKIAIIVYIIFLIIILIHIIVSFYKFSFYPTKLNYIFIFIDLFSLFNIVTELILYLIDSKIIKNYYLIILIIQFINSLIFCCLFIYKQNKSSFQLFSENLFSKAFKTLNPNDIYYYINAYIKFSENKEKNYIQLFKLIQNHILKCNKKDCAGNLLIPKSITYSKFSTFTTIKIDESHNENQIKNNISNEDKIDININNNINSKNFVNFKNNSVTFLDQNNNLSKRSIKDINNNLNILTNTLENRKSNLKKKKTEKNGSISLFSNTSKTLVNTITNSDKKLGNYLEIINDDSKNININNKKERLSDEQFKMIGEQEIINRINFLYKRKKYYVLQNYIFLHLQYLLKIKHNYRLALYFVGKYSLSGIKFNFLSKYFLYEFKVYIYNNCIQLKNSKYIKDPFIIKYRQENIFLKKLTRYLIIYQMIKKLIKIFCENIIYFFTFRTELHNSITLQKYLKSKIYPVIKSAEEIQNSISKLKFLIEKYYKEEKIPLESIELSYLISNYFRLINGKIPQDILKYISPILNFKEYHYEKLTKEFHHFNMNNPFIIYLTKKDSFNIGYFTNIFLDELGYEYSDLKNKDFHEKLFPGGQELIKEHTLLMKHFLFFERNSYSKEKTFLKSKEGFLISIDFTCKIFPRFYEDFFLIINITFNNDFLSNFFNHSVEYNKKTNFNNIVNEKKNIYSFILDYHFDFAGLTKNFYLEYELNQNMLRELRINFCQFFCINEIKLIEKINNEKKKLLKNNPILNHKISLRESNKAYTIFQNIKIENTFKLRDEKLLESYLFPSFYIYDKIDKKKLIHKIPEIINLIDEIGLDYDWYIRLQNFKDKLISNGRFQNIKDTGISNATNYNPQGDKRRSTIPDPNFFEIHYKYNPEQFFEVEYSVKKLGSISYYIVNLLEKINNIEEIQTGNEVEENTLNKRNSCVNIVMSKKQKKFSLQNHFKINNFLSQSKTVEEENKDDGNIKRKAKTKVFFPIFSMNTMNNNVKLLESKIIEDKLNKKNSIEIINKNNSAEINFDKKINNNEKIGIINNYNKRLSGEQKNYKVIKNRKYSRSNKFKKNETLEEDENVQLIPKDKFNEIITKINKINKILIIIISIIIVISMIIIIIKLIISMIGFEKNRTVLKAIIYLEMIKLDIYSQAILSMIYCIDEKNENRLSNIHSQAKNKNKMTIQHLKLFQEIINNIINNKYCQGIADILKEEIIMYYLNLDWSIEESKVHLIEEIRKLTFITYHLTYNDENCYINEIYNFSYYGEEFYKKNYINRSNIMQRIVYYFTRNSLVGYRNNLNKLVEDFGNTIEKMFITYQNIIFYLLICIIVFLIIFLVFYIIKVCLDYYYYQLLLLFYYNIENEQLYFENEIYYLYKVVLEFNPETINYFEFVKNNAHLILFNEEINRNYLNGIKSNNINNKNNINLTLKKKNNKRGSVFYKNNVENDKNKNLESKSINGNLVLNGSVNGSSVQLLNISNNNKSSLSNNINIANNNNNSLYSNKNEKDEKEESIDSLLKISNKILPNSLKISLFFILIGVIIFFGIALANIFETKKEKYIWKFSINISLNILERIPKIMGILIYSCITVITNNPFVIEGSPMKDNQPKYITYFKVNSLYYSEDIMNKYFKNNYFGVLLRDNLRINYNINNYLFQKENNVFKNTIYWENLLNKGEYFCIYASIGNSLFNKFNNTVYDFIKEIEPNVLTCKKDSIGIDKSGIKLEINYILETLTNKYIEFITFNNTNITLEQARDKFFFSKDLKRIFSDMQYPFLIYYNSIINAIYSDFENQTNQLIFNQLLYDTFLFLINTSILICLISVITEGEKNKRLFAYFLEMPKYKNN